MCGIAGYIGESKNPKLTYELITNLFDYLEFRGTDAAGIWGVESGKKARVIYHKEPIRSSKFIQTDIWKKVRRYKPDLLLCHARATSPGIGHARINSNNHPFVSTDSRIGMIHNGRVNEFDFLKKKYQTKSDTDSEVLLRMYEEGIDYNNPHGWIEDVDENICHRMFGIREIWSVVDRGAMAVALGERIDEHTRYLFLFRNEDRPLWLADTRDKLGQVFFFSEPNIWYRAVAESKTLTDMFLGSDDLIEVPVGQVFFFKIDEQNRHANEFHRFTMKITGESEKWEEGDYIEIQELESGFQIISQLDDEEEPIYKSQTQKGGSRQEPLKCLPAPTSAATTARYNCDDYGEDPFHMAAFSGIEHEELCTHISTLASDIDASVGNALQEGSLNQSGYQQILDSLEQTIIDLKGTLRLSGDY